MEVDSKRLNFLREEAFGGVCSMRVIDAAYQAEQMLGDQEELLFADRALRLHVNDQNSNEIEVEAHIYLKNVSNNDDNWMELGVTDSNQFRLPVVSLHDRSRSGQCSVAVLEPNSEDIQQWANSIVSSKNDEQKPLELNPDTGEVVYTATVVDAINDFLHASDNFELRNNMIEKLNVSRLTRSSIFINTSEDIDDCLEIPPTTEQYLRPILISKLGKMSVGSTFLLDKSYESNGRLSTSYSIETILTKTNQTALLDQIVVFGNQDRTVATTPYLPTISLSTGESHEDKKHFINTESDNGELSEDQAKLIETLARQEGYRKIFKLPKSNISPGTKESRNLARKSEDELIKEFMVLDFEGCAQKLSDLIAIIPSNEGSGLSLLRHPSILNNCIRWFQLEYAEQVDLLDLGKVYLPPIDNDNNQIYELFSDAEDIKVDLTAPGLRVFRGASNCSGVIVRGAHSAFTNADNLSNCKVIGTKIAFRNVSRSNNLNAYDCDDAFSADSKYFDVNMSNCLAEKCDNAFRVWNSAYSRYQGRIADKIYRQHITNSKWISTSKSKRRRKKIGRSS